MVILYNPMPDSVVSKKACWLMCWSHAHNLDEYHKTNKEVNTWFWLNMIIKAIFYKVHFTQQCNYDLFQLMLKSTSHIIKESCNHKLEINFHCFYSEFFNHLFVVMCICGTSIQAIARRLQEKEEKKRQKQLEARVEEEYYDEKGGMVIFASPCLYILCVGVVKAVDIS